MLAASVMRQISKKRRKDLPSYYLWTAASINEAMRKSEGSTVACFIYVVTMSPDNWWGRSRMAIFNRVLFVIQECRFLIFSPKRGLSIHIQI